LIVELLFKLVGLVPGGAREAKVTEAGVSWNYTTVLNIVFLVLAIVLVVRYFRRGGGVAMLRMMAAPDGGREADRHVAVAPQPHH
jgi:hypothetical protein